MKQWANVNAVLDRFVAEGTLTGCGLRVFQNNQLIFDRCTGVAAVDGSRPLTQDTLLRLHSMTKTFTCAGLMTLYEKGMFALDDPIANYLPEFSHPMVCVSDTDIHDVVPADKPITIRHLLTMTSGIPYWAFNPGEGIIQTALLKPVEEMKRRYDSGEQTTLAELVQIIAQFPLCFQPGEHWLYGLSLTVIGRLIEVLSGKTIGEYLRETIWNPLGLTHTAFSSHMPTDAEIAELTVSGDLCQPLGCKVGEEEIIRDRNVFGSKEDVLIGATIGVELPCGGIISTLRDISIFFAMFANGGSWNGTRILSRRTIDLMRANHLSGTPLAEFTQWDNNRGFGYGLGYRTMMDPAQAGFYMPVGSFGWDGAAGCYGLADPEHHLALIFAEQSIPHHISYTIPRVVAALNADMDLI